LLRLERRPVRIDGTERYPEIGIYCFGRGIFHKEPRTGLEVGDKALFQIREGDLILQVTFAWEGAIAVAGPAEDGMYGSARYPTFRVDQSCEPRYLQTYLTTQEGLDQIGRICPGSAGRNRVLSLKRLDEVAIPLPPIAEQRRIVSRIEALAAKFAEVVHLREAIRASLSAFVASFHVALSAGREVELGEVLELSEEHVSIELSEAYPQVGCRGFGGGLFSRGVLTGDQTTYKHFNRLYPGAVVLSQVKGWEGAIAVCPAALVNHFASPEYRTFRCRSGAGLPEYLATLIPSPWFWTKLKGITRGVGARRERTRPEHFLQMRIPMPDIDKQFRALRAFECVGRAAELQSATAAELDALLPSILDRAFRGEL
jgi:type I restriction enzyme S subunit